MQYPTIGQPQYGFTPTMPGMASGGLASLPVQRFQSGGITMGGLTSPMGSIMGMPVTPMDVVSMVARNTPLSVVNAVVNAYNAFNAKQDPAPIDFAKVDPYSPPEPGVPLGVPGTVSVQGISPGYTEPGRVQSIVEAMIAMQQEEQEQAQAEAQAAQNAQTAAQQAIDAAMDVSSTPDSGGANTGPGQDTSETGAMDAGIGGIGSAMGGSDGVGGGGGGMGANDGPGNDSSATGGADSSSEGGAGAAFRYGGRVMNYAEGGLPSLANRMASKGRYGDSMMVHMSPQEVQGLQRLAMANGTSLSINPYTGMPEAFSLKKIFKSIAKFLAPVLPFIPIPGLAGLSPLITKALLSTAVGGFGGKGSKFDLKRGLLSGLTTYGIGSLAQGAGAAANANAGANVGDIGAQQAADAAININATPVTPSAPSGAMMDAATGSILPPPDAAATAAPKFMQSLPEGSGFTDYVTQTGRNIQTAGQGLYDTVTGAPGARSAFAAFSARAILPAATLAAPLATGLPALAGIETILAAVASGVKPLVAL